MAAWADYYSQPPSDFGISPADGDWLANRLFELESMMPSLVIDEVGSLVYKGVLRAKYDFRGPIRNWSLLANGDPINLLFGMVPTNPVLLTLIGQKLAWVGDPTLVQYHEYMSGLGVADWGRIADHVRVWNPVLKWQRTR